MIPISTPSAATRVTARCWTSQPGANRGAIAEGLPPRFHVHYTPTYASWINQVEIWFNIITQRAIRRGTFKSVRDLIAKIEAFVKQYNRRCHPFSWTATADSILEKIGRLCKAVAGTGH